MISSHLPYQKTQLSALHVWPSPDALHSQPICLAGSTLPYPHLPCPCSALPAPSSQVGPPLDNLSASFPYSLPLATPLAGAKLLLRPHLSYIPRHHSRSPASHHRVSHAGSHSEQENSGAQLHVVRSIAALPTTPRQRIFPTPTLDLGAVLARCSRTSLFFPPSRVLYIAWFRTSQCFALYRPDPLERTDAAACIPLIPSHTARASGTNPGFLP